MEAQSIINNTYKLAPCGKIIVNRVVGTNPKFNIVVQRSFVLLLNINKFIFDDSGPACLHSSLMTQVSKSLKSAVHATEM